MKAHLVNLGGLVGALTLASWFSLAASHGAGDVARSHVRGPDSIAQDSTLVDADGVAFERRNFSRVVSLNPVADHLLIQLIEPERLLAFSSPTAAGHPEVWRFGGRSHVERGAALEAIFNLRPDLVIGSPFVDAAKVERLRDEGIAVFNLGEMRGLTSVRANIRNLGRLLGVADRAVELRKRLDREVRGLEVSRSEAAPRGLYLSVYGDAFFGGTAGTSYADVLELGGVLDVAAEAGLIDWPQYTSEQILSLSPDVLVTRRGMAETIRRHPVLSQLTAAHDADGIFEIDPAYDGDAGLGVIRAAASLQESIQRRKLHD